MQDRKKTLALLIHIPLSTRDDLELLRKEMGLDCISDVVIALVDKRLNVEEEDTDG